MAGAPVGESSLFVPDPSSHWWPRDLGAPNATGSQNNVRYAYFATARRLTVETNGQVWVYDTLDHRIGGFSQQQGTGGAILFTSQYGTVNLASLPIVSIDGRPPQRPLSAPPAPQITDSPALEGDVFTAIERLAGLRDKDVLTDEEFASKKAELLGRL